MFKKWCGKDKSVIIHKGGGGAFYGLGLLGVLFYYLQVAHTFGDFVWALIKAIFWPAFLAYHLYGFLGIH